MMTMTKILLLSLMFFTLSNAEPTKDQDMDGVPDSADECTDTPFLNEVNAKGCSTSTLIFPQERDNGSLDIAFGYGFNNNEEDVNRDIQYASKFNISYYLNNWSYTLRTGYFTMNDDSGMQDSTLKIKRKFRVSEYLKVSLGAGIKLPTYDFIGNNTDYTLYGSVIYYPVSALSLFAGVSHTFINDEEIFIPLQDINTLYFGSGYFFSKNFYINLAYSYTESKFTVNHPAHAIGSTLFYQISNKWFATLSYNQEIEDELHNSLDIKFAYRIW